MEIPLPPDIQGSKPPQIAHPIFADAYTLPFRDKYQGDWWALFEGDFKFLWNSMGKSLLFNLKHDPGETVNLIERNRKKAQAMGASMEKLPASLPKPASDGPRHKIDEQTREALKSLGYL